MSSKQIGGISAALVLAICVIAWIDGGEEPLRPIEEQVELPGGAK